MITNTGDLFDRKGNTMSETKNVQLNTTIPAELARIVEGYAASRGVKVQSVLHECLLANKDHMVKESAEYSKRRAAARDALKATGLSDDDIDRLLKG